MRWPFPPRKATVLQQLRPLLPLSLLPLLLPVALLIPHRCKAPPPSSDDMRRLPGRSAGQTKTYWLAPYVKVSEESIGPSREQTVTWYAEDGSVKTRRIVYSIQPGFVSAREDGQNILCGVNADWEFILPREVKSNEVVTIAPIRCSDDSHVLVHEFSSDRKQVSLKYYVDGKFANLLGPFVSYRGSSVTQGPDGSTALLIDKDDSKEKPQIVAANSKGALAFRIDCDESDNEPIPAPDAAGVLLQGMGGTDQRNFFNWYTAEGKLRAMELSPNPHCIGWVPETQKSLFSTSVGYDDRYHLIDWAVGRELWDISTPGGGQALSIAITPRLVLFAVAELYRGGPWSGNGWVFREDHPQEWIRDFYAVSIDDGHTVARWRAHYASRMSDEWERFVWRGKKLYFVTREEFLEISEDDILAHKDGWAPVGGPSK